MALAKHDVDRVKMALEKFRSLKLVDKEGDVIRGMRLVTLQQCKNGEFFYERIRNTVHYLHPFT